MKNIVVRLGNGEYWLIPKQEVWSIHKRAFREDAMMNGDVTDEQIGELRRSSDCICTYCGSKDGSCLDHIHPVSRGGKHTITNLTMSCLKCNSSKGRRTLGEWATWIYARNMIAMYLLGVPVYEQLR